MSRNIIFTEAIREAMFQSMELDQKVMTFGLGVTDPKGIFGTTTGLLESFGEKRVFDTPTAENAMTGIGIGAALLGYRPVMVHQRLDFFLLAMDQLVNSAAKWHYMFGGGLSVPITIRLVVGRGWGQGPTHSQNLHAWFAHIPGLKIVMPTTPSSAKGLLLSSIFDNNPVIFIEHRWLHNTIDDVAEEPYQIEIGKARLVKTGVDFTIVAMSYMVVEAIHAANFLSKFGINCEIIDLQSISPIDWDCIFNSIKKTNKLLVLDTGHLTGSVAGEIIARVSTDHWEYLSYAPIRLAAPDFPEPTSYGLTRNYHIRAENIVESISKLLNLNIDSSFLQSTRNHPHDVPGDWFKGPF
jgi:pyruvate/2-oxoglutarate/acetoin dehydrogenase E1 component